MRPYLSKLNTSHMETGPGPCQCSLPSPLLGKSYISAKKKCTHPVLIRPGKKEGSGRGYPMEAPHMSLAEQKQAGRRAGRHAAAFYMVLVLSL